MSAGSGATAVLGLWAALAATGVRAADAAPAPREVRLLWHVETIDGEVLESSGGDEPINPASVVKVATSLRALATLGPDYRFETRFRADGAIDPVSGRLDGDLVVEGGFDPDFHVENAFLVAAELNRAGLQRVGGALAVDTRFWIGWEGGSDRRIVDPVRRATEMATRLRRALDPALWDRSTRRTWNERARTLGFDPAHPPRIVSTRTALAGSTAGELLATHRSNPLPTVLRRFNAYSNNDIERFDAVLGPPADLGPWLAQRLGADPAALRFDTTSGLGTNRMTARLVVGLLRNLERELLRHDLAPAEVLSVAGCDRGTVTRLYPTLARTRGVLAGKTGTLTHTDGGVSVLAGILHTVRGDLLVCVVAPGVENRIDAARRATERWVLSLLGRHGAVPADACAAPPGGPADQVQIVGPAPVLNAPG